MSDLAAPANNLEKAELPKDPEDPKTSENIPLKRKRSRKKKIKVEDSVDVTHISAWQIILTKVQRINDSQVAAKVLFYELAEVRIQNLQWYFQVLLLFGF